MLNDAPVPVSQLLLGAFGMRMFAYYKDRIPEDATIVVVSNHRSFMDASVIIQALNRPIRTACHHYMGQIPVMREFVELLGCFPLEERDRRLKAFFRQATELLHQRQSVCIFPEGTQPMVEVTPPQHVGQFQRGFAHLAFRAEVPNLAVLPIAIASTSETISWAVPLKFLRLFDPSEPLFDRPGLHPVVIYKRANVMIGRPYWITDKKRQRYQGKDSKQIVTELTDYCHKEITSLLYQGCQ